ncbi:MAG TPA: DUF5103 domain-containing protein [Flavobacteriaceae bacterium]|nr:DUF5103 domain-containing protein [Flavobacteriaceae bacterium]
MKKHILYLLLLTGSIGTQAQIAREVHPPEYIKTVTFKGNTPESQLPVLKLGDRLILQFDALNANEDDFYYTIEHYNFDWTPSVLFRNEFLIGMDNQRIVNYENSFNTYQIYSNYTLTIPNAQTRGFKVSGNYMLKVFDEYNNLVFSRKFMVYEDLCAVGVAVKRARDVATIDQMQTLDLKIVPNRIQVVNPIQTIRTTLIQNNNLNTAITNVKPQYTLGNELIYRYTNETAFWAGNEYLFFENKDLRAANTGVRFIELKNLYHSHLFTDIVRHNRPYTYNPDINGNFLITAIDTQNPTVEADYAWVHFSLMATEFFDKKVYVYGNYNNYALTPENQMTYNPEKGIYEATMLLKQGFYNYKYVTLDSNQTLNEGEISGNFYQTENNYKVLVYYRELGGRYDRLIGFGEATSVNISN